MESSGPGQYPRFSHLTAEDGLAHNVANDIIQNSWASVWISTFAGLNRFDGYEIQAFRHDPDDMRSLSDSHVRAMAIDLTGFI